MHIPGDTAAMHLHTDHELLQQRLRPEAGGLLTVDTGLAHFALITYAIPAERLERHIPSDRFEIERVTIAGRECALISAVPFLDVGFHFKQAPFARFTFGQTNYRAYIRNRATGEPCVWFFGTTLGSPIVAIPRALWRIPWHRAQYAFACDYDAVSKRYTRYEIEATSAWSAMQLTLNDSGTPAGTQPGFSKQEASTLILTHPVTGYFNRLDGALGTYRVWHDLIPLTEARATRAYFGIFERLALLTRDEMRNPVSTLVCSHTRFRVLLPPRRAR